ncbi:hypothetical protein IFR05_005052 [Cadophora sp. M221]|nr:hypothetical protein IFR05_005052 [Cadophora sp. M221]
MSRISLFLRLNPINQKAKEELYEHLVTLSRVTQDTEPGVLRYSYATAYDPEDELIYMIEEYASQEAANDHMKTKEYSALVKWIGTGALGAGPAIQRMVPADPLINNFVRPQIALQQSNVALIYTEVIYHPGKAATVLEHWKAVAKVSEDQELGTLLWGAWKDPGQDDRVFIVHAYESLEYLFEEHVNSRAMKNFRALGDEYIKEMNVLKLKVEGGFLYKKFE